AQKFMFGVGQGVLQESAVAAQHLIQQFGKISLFPRIEHHLGRQQSLPGGNVRRWRRGGAVGQLKFAAQGQAGALAVGGVVENGRNPRQRSTQQGKCVGNGRWLKNHLVPFWHTWGNGRKPPVPQPNFEQKRI